VAKAAIISAIPPLMVKTPANPGGLPKDVFDGYQAALAANRSQFYRDVPEGPFYGYNRPGAKASEAVIANWWRQGMMGGAKAHYDGIVAFSQTDFTEDLKKITVPVLVMHGDDDQIVPYANAGPLSASRSNARSAVALSLLLSVAYQFSTSGEISTTQRCPSIPPSIAQELYRVHAISVFPAIRQSHRPWVEVGSRRAASRGKSAISRPRS